MDIQEAISEFKMENALLGVRNPVKVSRNELAISALQEQAEREKGCEYCENEIYMKHPSVAEVPWGVAAKFCPMCGRRLK
jgi:hypothetical protein